MSGKIVGIVILFCAAAAGAALYYLQVYGFYRDVSDTDAADIVLTETASGSVLPLDYSNFRAIDADSSPIRYRACFDTTQRPTALEARFEPLTGVTPRNAPGWFDCFDAEAIAAELAAGSARAFLGVKNVAFGVDRIVVLTDDGRGFAWHELNDCGEKAYDGTVVGEECPPRPEPAGGS